MGESKKLSFIERIKNWWKQRQQKTLPEGEPQYKEVEENEFDKRYKIEGEPPTILEKGTLDYAVEQYLTGLAYQAQIGMKYSSYRVLTDLGGISNAVSGNNQTNENNLINYLKNREDIKVNGQFDSKTGNANFWHVKKNFNSNSNISKRIYLNCNRENIALLATNLTKNMDDMDSYYFKFNSDYQASNKTRSEQFVFYIEDDKQLNDVMQRIEKTKKENPELFKGDENINPFLKNVDGYMAYANEPQRYENSRYTSYIDLNNRARAVAVSYNTVLSTALEDSLMTGINNMLLNNNKLGNDLSNEELNNPAVYATKVLPRILEDGPRKMELIESMKKSLVELSDKNPTLDIQGIDKEKEKQMSEMEADYSK